LGRRQVTAQQTHKMYIGDKCHQARFADMERGYRL
jgi:hypothetical protein